MGEPKKYSKGSLMMDYSLRGYLERRSTEELDAILNFVVNNYGYATEGAVRMIIEILEEREKHIKPEISQELQVLWEHYLEKIRQQQNSIEIENDPE